MRAEHFINGPDLAALLAPVEPLKRAAVLPLPAESGEGIDKLLGLQAFGCGAVEDKRADTGLVRGQLIGAAVTDKAEGVLEVVAVGGEIGSQPV